MASKRKPPVLTSRVRQRQQPLRLKIGQDDYDRAQVLAQLATDLSAHRDIRDSVLFKGGAVLQRRTPAVHVRIGSRTVVARARGHRAR